MNRRGDETERDAILTALTRVLKGTSQHGSGRVTVKAVADEAGIARSGITQRNLDLKALIDACGDLAGRRLSEDGVERIERLSAKVAELEALTTTLAEQVAAAALKYTPESEPNGDADAGPAVGPGNRGHLRPVK